MADALSLPGTHFLRNLVERRSLLFQLVRRDFQQRFVGSVAQPASVNIENPDNSLGATGAGAYGFAIYLAANGTSNADISGLYSVTAP